MGPDADIAIWIGDPPGVFFSAPPILPVNPANGSMQVH